MNSKIVFTAVVGAETESPESGTFPAVREIQNVSMPLMLGLKETVVQMAKVNGVRWYGHVLRRDDGHVLRKACEGQEEARTTKEDVEDASGEGEQECWFGDFMN